MGDQTEPTTNTPPGDVHQPVEAAPEPENLRREVKFGDFFPFGKKTCPGCIGTGRITVTAKLYREGPKDTNGNPTRIQQPGFGPTQPKVCACAMRRFMKKHGKDVEVRKKDDALVWKEGHQPPVFVGKAKVDP